MRFASPGIVLASRAGTDTKAAPSGAAFRARWPVTASFGMTPARDPLGTGALGAGVLTHWLRRASLWNAVCCPGAGSELS